VSNSNLPHQENPTKPQPCPTLCVTAPCSNSGKTVLIEKLLPYVRSVGVLKISPIPATGDDRRHEHQPTTITSADSFYLSPPDELTIPGKDTAKLQAAGAVQVERLRYHPAGLNAGLDFAMARFEPGLPLIIEGGSAAYHLPTAAVLLVARPPLSDIKPTTIRLLERVDYLLVNAPPAKDQIEQVAKMLVGLNSGFRPKDSWHLDLLRDPLPAGLVATVGQLISSHR